MQLSVIELYNDVDIRFLKKNNIEINLQRLFFTGIKIKKN